MLKYFDQWYGQKVYYISISFYMLYVWFDIGFRVNWMHGVSRNFETNLNLNFNFTFTTFGNEFSKFIWS